MQIDGACHCGRIRYVAQVDPGRVTICHCTDCQALTGTAFRVSVSARADDIRVDGTPRIYVKTGDSGRRRNQHFCGDCGAPLFTSSADDDGGDWGIRWGGVRQRGQLAPTRQIWRRSAAAWVCAFDGAPAEPTE